MKIKTRGENKALFNKLFTGIKTRYGQAKLLRARYVTLRRVSIAAGITFGILVLSYIVQFYWPRTVTFSFAGSNCFVDPVLLPKLTRSRPSTSYDVTIPGGISIGHYPLYSHYTCVKATQPPSDKTETIALRELGNGFFKKNIKVLPGKPPILLNVAVFNKPLPAKEPLSLTLESADLIYDYRLTANGKSVDCTEATKLLTCDIEQLGLAQSTQYELSLQRLFNGKIASEVFKQTVTTVDPLHMVASSITPDQTVFNVPTDISFTFDKPIKSFTGEKLELVTGDTRQSIPVRTDTDDKTLTLHLLEPLARSASFILTLGSVTSPDGSTLTAPLTLPFKTSGGPKAVHVNIGSYKVATSGNIVLTFDSPLDAAQDISPFIHVESLGSVLGATLTKKGTTVTIKLNAAMGRCTSFTVRVLDGMKNEFGISGGSAWQFKSRTICQSVFNIGTSVQGRGITAYSFGSGPSKIIFMGNIHGNEKSSTTLLNKWIDTLEANPGRIPASRTIIVLPNVNPDGYAADQRTNAHNVDLNRNFPSNDWKSGVTMPDGSYLATGGGTSALSEPESSAVASYVLSQNPRLVLSYHASGAVVTPNESGDSQAIALTYAQKSTVGYLSSGSNGSFFAYDITGSFESWMHDKYNLPAILIELTTKTGNEYSGHQNALWYAAELP